MSETPDVIRALAAIAPDSPLAALYAQRPEIAHYAQGSYHALLTPDAPGGRATAACSSISHS